MVWKSLCFWTIFKVFSTERSQNIYIHTDTNNIKYEGKNQQQIERKSAFAERRTLQMRFDVALNFVTTFLSPYCCVQLQLIQIYDKWRKKNYLFCFICSLLAVCVFFFLVFRWLLLWCFVVFKKFCVWFYERDTSFSSICIMRFSSFNSTDVVLCALFFSVYCVPFVVWYSSLLTSNFKLTSLIWNLHSTRPDFYTFLLWLKVFFTHFQTTFHFHINLHKYSKSVCKMELINW